MSSSTPFADEHGATLKLRAGFDAPTLTVIATLLSALGLFAATFSTLNTTGKGTLAVFYLALVVHWVRRQQQRVSAKSRLHLHPDGDLLLRLGESVNWRGKLERRSWCSQVLVLLQVTIPAGTLWLPICRHRQMKHEFRRLLVGLRHDRWNLARR